jgi:hypothetical protein
MTHTRPFPDDLRRINMKRACDFCGKPATWYAYHPGRLVLPVPMCDACASVLYDNHLSQSTPLYKKDSLNISSVRCIGKDWRSADEIDSHAAVLAQVLNTLLHHTHLGNIYNPVSQQRNALIDAKRHLQDLIREGWIKENQ